MLPSWKMREHYRKAVRASQDKRGRENASLRRRAALKPLGGRSFLDSARCGRKNGKGPLPPESPAWLSDEPPRALGDPREAALSPQRHAGGSAALAAEGSRIRSLACRPCGAVPRTAALTGPTALSGRRSRPGRQCGRSSPTRCRTMRLAWPCSRPAPG